MSRGIIRLGVTVFDNIRRTDTLNGFVELVMYRVNVWCGVRVSSCLMYIESICLFY